MASPSVGFFHKHTVGFEQIKRNGHEAFNEATSALKQQLTRAQNPCLKRKKVNAIAEGTSKGIEALGQVHSSTVDNLNATYAGATIDAETRITNLEYENATKTTRIDALETEVADLKSEVAELKSENADLKAENVDLKQRFTTLEDRFAKLEAKVLPRPSQLRDPRDEKICHLQQIISTQQTDLSTLCANDAPTKKAEKRRAADDKVADAVRLRNLLDKIQAHFATAARTNHFHGLGAALWIGMLEQGWKIELPVRENF